MNDYQKLSPKCLKEKRCPCRQWINCRHYVDDTKRQLRLKWKHLHDPKLQETLEWYNYHFRIDWIADSYCANG